MSTNITDLSEKEKKLYSLIQTDKTHELKDLLKERDVRIDCVDEHGMTPLQQAAYKGNKDVCEVSHCSICCTQSVLVLQKLSYIN